LGGASSTEGCFFVSCFGNFSTDFYEVGFFVGASFTGSGFSGVRVSRDRVFVVRVFLGRAVSVSGVSGVHGKGCTWCEGSGVHGKGCDTGIRLDTGCVYGVCVRGERVVRYGCTNTGVRVGAYGCTNTGVLYGVFCTGCVVQVWYGYGCAIRVCGNTGCVVRGCSTGVDTGCVVRVCVVGVRGTGVWWCVPIVCCRVSTIVYGTGVVLSGTKWC